MFGLQLGRLGIAGSLFNESALWPLGATSPGLWIDPSYVASCFQDSAGTTPLSTVGTVLDSANPVGLMLDRKAGATTLAGAGIHLLQATSAARPVASARVNLLTYSEDLTNAAWVKNGVAADSATLIRVTTAGGSKSVSQSITLPASPIKIRITTKAGNSDQFAFGLLGGSWLGSAAIVSGPGTLMVASGLCGIVGLTSSITVIDLSVTVPSAGTYTLYYYPGNWYADAPVGATVEILQSQLNLGSTALPYQRVGAASSYTADGFPVYAKTDGADDGWLSATFTANTSFTAGMDALIAVRRDSSANAVCGLYNAVGDATKFFGMAQSGSGSTCVGSGAGTPTVWVDNTQLTGGTAVTRDTLHTALTPGAWHILEFRNLDLSAWTAIGACLYTSYVLNGAIGNVYVFANGQDANREKAKRRMASYFGVTLA